MKKLLFAFCIHILTFAHTKAQTKDLSTLTPVFDKLLTSQYKQGEPGAAVIVSKKGQVIYKKATGMANMEWNEPMKENAVFRIASLTKQFTAIAILQLMEAGKLSLSDNITKYIPGYPAAGASITIEHLLTHTSGIQDYTAMKDYVQIMNLDFTPVQMIDHFKNEPLLFAPGTKYSYSNSGYFLLGYIIEMLTGKTYGQYLDEHFFKPLGMQNSLYANDKKIIKNRVQGYTVSNKGFENAQELSMTQPYAAGAILSTVEDMLKWHQAVQSYKLVKKETLDKAFTRYKLTNGQEIDYGYGWRLGNVYKSPVIWHGGAINGFMTVAVYLPAEDVYVSILSNIDAASPKDLALRFASIAAGKPYRYQPIALQASQLQDYIGVYENNMGMQRVVNLDGNNLYVQAGRGPKSPLKAHAKDHFYYEADAMATLDFARNNSGSIEKLIIGSLTGTETWNKTNKPLPSNVAIKVDEKILEGYVGAYQLSPNFVFEIVKEGEKLFLQAPGQEKIEMFAETQNKFYLKVNDAQFEFVRDGSGKVTKALMSQGGRAAEVKKIR